FGANFVIGVGFLLLVIDLIESYDWNH
ncbi:MAG: hypothetical protein JWO19_5771, partial [Bryobacterales bacterium]|nr:hypothetical protein [Bryobacterales bacterium]